MKFMTYCRRDDLFLLGCKRLYFHVDCGIITLKLSCESGQYFKFRMDAEKDTLDGLVWVRCFHFRGWRCVWGLLLRWQPCGSMTCNGSRLRCFAIPWTVFWWYARVVNVGLGGCIIDVELGQWCRNVRKYFIFIFDVRIRYCGSSGSMSWCCRWHG